MANLLGQDIGLNYKGIITIGSTINQNVSASLQSLTDGDGNNLPIQVSTTAVVATGALTVGSDITGGFSSYTLGFSNPYVRINLASSSVYGGFLMANNGNITRTTGETSTSYISGLFAAAAGAANYKPLRIEYTLNNSGAQTGATTGIFLNATETALNSMTHNLLDLQVATVSRFKIGNGGNTFIGGSTTTARLNVRGDGTNPIVRFEDSTGTVQLSSTAAGAFTFIKVVNMDAAGLTVGSGRMVVAPFASNQARMKIGDTGASSLMGAYGNNTAIIQFTAPTQGSMGGAVSMLVEFTHSYTSAATGEYTHIQVNNTINHTSTGIDRLLYLKPVITASPDFRAIDVLTGSTSAHKLILLANAAGNKVFEVNAAQQIGLFGVTPIAQPTTAISQAAVTPGGGGSILEDDLFAGYTVAQVVQALVNLGILKP